MVALSSGMLLAPDVSSPHGADHIFAYRAAKSYQPPR